MPKLFGLDIAKIVADNISQAGGVLDVTLTKQTPGTRDPNNLTGGVQPTPTNYAAKGYKDSLDMLAPGSLHRDAVAVVSILGATIENGAVPEPGDRVTVEGKSYVILRIDRDPAAALYQCQVS